MSGIARHLARLLDDTARFMEALDYRRSEVWGEGSQFREGSKKLTPQAAFPDVRSVEAADSGGYPAVGPSSARSEGHPAAAESVPQAESREFAVDTGVNVQQMVDMHNQIGAPEPCMEGFVRASIKGPARVT